MVHSLGQLMFVSDQAVLKLGLDEVYKLTIISTGQKRILYVYFKPESSGNFIVYHGVVYFSNFTDQVCTVTDPSAVSEPVTDISKKYCYTDGVCHLR
nr:galactocerebrosidase-like [Biomphalaria glabrata]